MMMIDLLSSEARLRRSAVAGLRAAELAEPATGYALRRLLATDPDVAVRAAAAEALGRVPQADGAASGVSGERTAGARQPSAGTGAGLGVGTWLIDALDDVSPVVRDAAIRALARRKEGRAMAGLRERAAGDVVWWVRRAAIYALGVIGSARSVSDEAARSTIELVIDSARAAIADPFWRVRHAAVQVLAVYGNRQPERREEILARVEGGSADFLRALWGPTLVEDPRAPAIASRLPEALLDRDPAVVTARLAAMVAPPPTALVELLCEPHVPLRELAVERLLEAGDVEAFTAALRWLDEPRIPHVAVTVIEMLDGLGDPARALAAAVLAEPARPGASRWAIGWAMASGDEALAGAAWRRAEAMGEPELAAAAAPIEALIGMIGETVGEAIGELPGAAAATGESAAGAMRRRAIAAAEELLRRPAAERRHALEKIGGHPLAAVRSRLVAGAELGSARLLAALHDEAPAPRAVALVRLAATGALTPAQLASALGDEDPAIREAVAAAAAPAQLLALLEGEGDPWVRQAAGQALAAAALRERKRVARAGVAPGSADAGAIALTLADEADPWLRAKAALLLEPARAQERARLLALAADPSPMVQAAVIAQLLALTDEELAAELPNVSAPVAAVLGAWLAAAHAPEAAAFASAPAQASGERTAGAEAGAVTDELGASSGIRTSVISGGGAPEAREAREARAGSPAIAPLRRRLGRSGLEVAPLAISGAFELSPGSLHAAAEAGVELFFWEPTYAAMARFLRGRSMRTRAAVVTGSYHADAASITLDVERALRRLRRDTLEVFLLFWARSSARLDEAAFAAVERLKQAGHVRAVGFSTHDRALAIEALDRSPWDVVMTRHSAAHPGIEAELLPHAAARGASVLTFSALCYGRMVSGPGAPSPADCYRYSLSQPGVTACISAPRRHRELMENLEVVGQPLLDAAAITALRAHGEGVRLENQRFGSLIRQPTRDAAAAAMALLEAELPPRGEGGEVQSEVQSDGEGQRDSGDGSAVAGPTPTPRPSRAPRTGASLGRSLTARDPSRRLRRGRL